MFICETRTALKKEVSYAGAAIQFSTIGGVIGPNEAIKTEALSRDGLEDFQSLFDGTGDEKLFLYGYVFYNDIFQKSYVTGFAAVWDPEQQCMRLTSGSEGEGYNYRYKIGAAKSSSLWLRLTRRFKRLAPFRFPSPPRRGSFKK